MSKLIPEGQMSPEAQNTDNFSPIANILAANSMAQAVSFFSERKYLGSLTTQNTFYLKAKASDAGAGEIHWLKIEQLGKPLDGSSEACFTAIQKILYSSFLPSQIQLLFMIHCEEGLTNLYLGIRPLTSLVNMDLTEGLQDFIVGVWPGLKSTTPSKAEMEKISAKIDGNRTSYRSVYAMTGIPSMESQYKTVYPATMDKLISGMNGRNYTYLVIADPVPETEVDQILYKCRETAGQAESIKSFNFSENTGTSVCKSYSVAKAESESVSNKKKNVLFFAASTGLALASVFFTPATILVTLNQGIKELVGVNVLAGFAPEETRQHQTSTTTTDSESFTTNQCQTLSRNIVSKHVQAIVEHLDYHSKRLETGKANGCWNVGVYLMGDNPNITQTGALQLKSILSGQESIYEPMRTHDVSSLVKPIKSKSLACFEAPNLTVCINGNEGEMPIQHPFGHHYQDLRTLLTTKELSYLINFPLTGVPGISVVDSFPDFNLNKQVVKEEGSHIDLGRLIWNGSKTNIEVKLPIDTLSRHSLVVGVNGSGKTNTVLGIIENFMKRGRPFLVIEPAKTEYVDWAYEYNKTVKDPSKKVKVFIPGCEYYAKADAKPDKLRINPFEVISLPKGEMRILSHIDRLKSIFAAAFPMQDILPVIMEHLLYDLYTTIDPMMEGTTYLKKGFPTLDTIDRAFIDNLMTNIGYARENTQNISAALRTRMKSLKFGWKGEMLNNPKLTGDAGSWENLFGSPVVVNLSYAGDDQDRAFIMSLLLQFLYEYRIAESEAGIASFKKNECRHLVVVEEAHRVMSRCENPEMPQFKSGQMFSNFLSEVRAYGQGMMVVDQIPSRLIEDAVKNTNVKIIHKLVASDDASLIAECIGLTPEQQRVISKLSVGQAVLAGLNSADVMSSSSGDIYLAQLNKMK